MTRVLSIAPSPSSEERTRPIWASVWVRNPAKTSCWRACMRRSSAERSLQARTHSGRGVSTVPSGTMPDAHWRGEQLLPPGVPSLVEHAAVGVDPLGRDVVRGVHRPEREVQEEGLARRSLLLVLHHADGLIGQVLAQVVPVLGPARWLDVVVVAQQVRGPMVGVALQEAVVALEPEAERPGVEGTGGRALPARCEVPLAHGHGGVAGVAQEAGEGGGRLGQAGVIAGEGQRDVGQESHPDRVVVAPGEEGGPRRRAQRGDVEPVERGASRGQAVEVRRPDVRAEGAQVAETGVVEHDGDDVRGRCRRLRIVGEAGGRLRRREADLLGFVHGSRG